jgi:F-type H+-transporting ATPase subunit b
MFGAEFWVAAAFLVFVAVGVRLGWSRMTAALDARSDRIRNELEEAVRLREEAQQLLATYQRKHRDAVKEAEEIVAHARTEAERMAAEAAAELETEVRRRTELAQAKIARAEAQVIEEVRNLAVDVAVRAAGRLIRENLDDTQAQRLVDDAIGELGRKVH